MGIQVDDAGSSPAAFSVPLGVRQHSWSLDASNWGTSVLFWVCGLQRYKEQHKPLDKEEEVGALVWTHVTQVSFNRKAMGNNSATQFYG